MGAFLNSDDNSDSHLELFKALREAFACDQAMLLENHGDDLECIASMSGELIGRRWAVNIFKDILAAGSWPVTVAMKRWNLRVRFRI